MDLSQDIADGVALLEGPVGTLEVFVDRPRVEPVASAIDDCNAGRPLERPRGKAAKLVFMRGRGVGRLVEE